MNYNQHKKIVGLITILSGIVAFISYFLVAAAVNFNFDFFSNPVIIFSLENVNISMLRWSMITDVFGYYLLLLPALYFIYDWLKDKTPWKNLLTFCGTSYILIGAVGASILSSEVFGGLGQDFLLKKIIEFLGGLQLQLEYYRFWIHLEICWR